MKLILVLWFGLTCVNAIEVEIEACNQGNIASCYEVGIILTTGENAEDQEKKNLGLEYMRKACGYGEEKACDILGENYFKNGNFGASIPYLKRSCDRNIVSACEGLGTIYRDGHETKQDDVTSREYYEKACELGSKDSCINVAIIYRGGFGVQINREKEKIYYQKACDLGSKAGCNAYTKLDNEDKGIAQPGIWDKLKSVFN